MSEVHFAEAQLKRTAIASSQQVIALIDSNKFGRDDLTPFARPSQITHLISYSKLLPEWIEKLQQAGINYTLSEEHAIPAKRMNILLNQ